MLIVAPPPSVRTVVGQRALGVLGCRGLAAVPWLLACSGCFTGLPDGAGPVPWDSDTDATDGTDDGAGDSAGASAGGSADPSAGEASSADPSGATADPSSADGGTADPSGTGDATTDDPGGSTGDPTAADGGTDGGVPVDVPDNEYCVPVAVWPADHAALEVEILEIVNQRRAEGADCHSEGSFGPAGPLTMHPALRCAARMQSKQMVESDYFDHTTPWGETPWDRMAAAGYTYSTAGENIAAGNSTAVATMQQWMDSDGHCSNIMNPAFTEIGVGYFPGGGYGYYWTQTFGAP